MKKEKDEDLDKLFKNGFEDPVSDPVYREDDWESMEQLLDQGKKRSGMIFLLPWLSSAAAIILVLLGWLFFKPNADTNNIKKGQPHSAVAKPSIKDTGISGGSIRHESADSSKQKILTPANYATNPVHHGRQKNANRSLPYLPVESAATLPVKGAKGNDNRALASNAQALDKSKKEPAAVNNDQPVQANNLAANKPVQTDNKDNNRSQTAGIQKNQVDATTLANNAAVTAQDTKDAATTPAKPDAAPQVAATTPKPKAKLKVPGANRAIFAISAIATTDMNGVNSLQGARVGGNIGGLFSVSVNKWTFTTGLMYSIKPYQESFANYHTNYPFQTNPLSIGVNCKMLDIPLNVNYQVYKSHGNKITIGSGLSSYIILREDYKFNYAAGAGSSAYANNAPGPAGYSVINQNRNILGVLNLDATYDHQINSKFGISFQPYLKLPLSNVGASQVKLQSAGVAVGLSWNLNSFKKPD